MLSDSFLFYWHENLRMSDTIYKNCGMIKCDEKIF